MRVSEILASMKTAITESLGSTARERRSKWRLLLLCLALVGRSLAVAQEPAIGASRIPHHMTVCEGTDQMTCGTWTFTGIEGTGRWSNGAAANLTIQQFDPKRVVIRRTDTSGSSVGLTAIYVGQQHGQRVEGTVKWTWLGHWNQEAQGTWYATFDEPGSTAPASRPQESAPQIGQEARAPAIDASRVPHHMTVCEGTGQMTCGTWTFTGIEGTGRWSNGAAANLTIQQFDPNRVIIRRTDTSGNSVGLTAIYIGQQHGQRVEGKVKWTWLGHWNQEVQGVWYATFVEPGSTASASRPAQQEVTVSIAPARLWTDTGILLERGQSITVRAHGTMNWYTGACEGKCLSTPAGIPCPGRTTKPFGLTCMSLIGRIGQSGAPFEVGESLAFKAPAAGKLFLGVNDEYLPDNTGEWTAEISTPENFQFASLPPRQEVGVQSPSPPPTSRSSLPPCTPEVIATVSADEAVEHGLHALQEMDPGLAGCWWQVGVAQGSHSAEFYLGIWYEFGQAGTKDHTEAMRLLHRAAAGGFVPARDTLVCLSPEVKRAMEELMVDVGSSPEALAANVFGALLFGVTAEEKNFSVVDMAPGNFSSDVNFSCTAKLQGTRGIRTLSDENGEEHTVVPKLVGSLVPVFQTYEIALIPGKNAYRVTLAYAGYLGGPRFALSRPYSRQAAGPVW